MKRCLIILGLASLLAQSIPVVAQTEYEIDLSKIQKEIEKKPYAFGGFLEVMPVLSVLDRDALFYRLKFEGQDQGDISAQYRFGLRLHGSYQKSIAAIHFTADSFLRKIDSGWQGKAKIFEGYLSLKSGPNFSLDIGKRVMKWGKGYAWNPVAFFDRSKDPEDPQEALEGFYLVSSSLVKSFNGALKTLSLTPVLVPVARSINGDFGESGSLGIGGKIYLLLLDTDIDILLSAGSGKSNGYGVDFSRNLRTNFEVHGELAWMTNREKHYMDSEGTLGVAKSEGKSALLGLRYLTATETTLVAEYYRNGMGFTQEEVRNYLRFVPEGFSPEAVISANSATEIISNSLGRPNPMRDYLYLRASQKEPYNLLYFTPEITSIINMNDRSLLFMPGLTYSPKTNLQLRARGAVLIGGHNDEYGGKQSDYRLELRLRYFF